MEISQYFKLWKITPIKNLGKFWHKNGNYYEYILYSDNYVYQRINGILKGWFCSTFVWERTMHKILI